MFFEMKVLLVSVNASFMHTGAACRALKVFAGEYFKKNSLKPVIECAEFTINQPAGEVLRSIGFTGADMVLFSTYIWNAEYVCKILPDVKKILPGCTVGAGGPEFGYAAEKYLKMLPALDFIIWGEGEQVLCNVLEKKNFPEEMASVKGIYFRDDSGKVIFSGAQCPVENLDILPFCYPELLTDDYDPDHKIYYYESTRGCPFSCAYCLSSVDKKVRFKSLEKVKQELKIFLDAGVKLVKFIDRTFNLNADRYIPVWQFILENHNGKTMFHFEIEAEYLSQEALDFLQKVPPGVMQFEMGVQSANKETLRAVNRSDNVETLAQKIRRIPRTIHQHLDLIAGLPYENLESFGHSYDFVMNLRPDALQLGFLKVLEGTVMADFARKNGWKWMENPVYETFSTPYLSFKDFAYLKNIETVTDAYWNKDSFDSTMNYIFRKVSPWTFMCSITDYGKKNGAFDQARREAYWFELLSGWIKEKPLSQLDYELVKDLLRYDYISSGKKGNFPQWYEHRYNKEKHKALLDKKELLNSTRIGFAISDFEVFDYDVLSDRPEEHPGTKELLIRYDLTE